VRLSRRRNPQEAPCRSKKPSKVAIISYDEKPGVQAPACTRPSRGNKRHGTLSLLAGIDLLTGKVHALVKDRHDET
jgi:hypothetical protein